MAFKYNMDLIAYARLSVLLSDSATSMTLMAGQGAEFLQPPAIAVLSKSIGLSDLKTAEHIRLDDRTGDVLTITRGILGTPQEWPVGSYVFGFWSPEHFTNLYQFQDMVEEFLRLTVAGGKTNVVFKRTNNDFDAVITSGLNLGITPGACFANGLLFSTKVQSDFTFSLPITLNRIDLVQADAYSRIISVKTGVEGGSSPSPDLNNIALWDVLLTPTHTDIILGDLTDRRVW